MIEYQPISGIELAALNDAAHNRARRDFLTEQTDRITEAWQRIMDELPERPTHHRWMPTVSARQRPDGRIVATIWATLEPIPLTTPPDPD